MRNRFSVLVAIAVLFAGCSDPVAPVADFDGTYELRSVALGESLSAPAATGVLSISGNSFEISYTVEILAGFPPSSFVAEGHVLRMPNPSYVRLFATGQSWSTDARIEDGEITTDSGFGRFIWQRQ